LDNPGDYAYAVMISSLRDKEIIKIDIVQSSVNGLSISRGQGGTQARAWNRGTRMYQDVTADMLNAVIQKGIFRTIDYNPNGVLIPAYLGEKVHQSDDPRWWKSYDAVTLIWVLIAGEMDSGDSWLYPTDEGSVSVSMFCETDGATIRYTTDGSMPTESSMEYTAAIDITESTSLKARAFKTDYVKSSIAGSFYTIINTINWVSIFDNSKWTPDAYGRWDGSKWVSDAIGVYDYLQIEAIGDWTANYFPTKVRITFTGPSIMITLRLMDADNNIITTIYTNYTSGAAIPITYSGKPIKYIKSYDDYGKYYGYGTYSFTNIEFLE